MSPSVASAAQSWSAHAEYPVLYLQGECNLSHEENGLFVFVVARSSLLSAANQHTRTLSLACCPCTLLAYRCGFESEASAALPPEERVPRLPMLLWKSPQDLLQCLVECEFPVDVICIFTSLLELAYMSTRGGAATVLILPSGSFVNVGHSMGTMNMVTFGRG